MRFAVALVPMLLVGCVFGSCEYGPDNASWHDPDMWDAVQAPIQIPDGVEMGNDTLRLSYVQIAIAQSGIPVREDLLWHHGDVHATAADGKSAAVRAAAWTFFRNATTEPEPWVDALMATETREDFGRYLNGDADEHLWLLRYRLPFDFNGTAFLAALGGEPDGTPLRVGDTTVGFSPVWKQINIGPFALRVEALGHVQVDGRIGADVTDAAYQARVEEALGDAGLPVPPDMHVSGVVC